VKALTVCQPHAERIRLSEKRVENRTWYTLHRGWLAIHAGKSRDWLEPGDRTEYPDMTFGAVVAVTQVTACLHLAAVKKHTVPRAYAWVADHVWTIGPWCWVLEQTVSLQQPVPCRGMPGVFDLDDQTSRAVLGQVRLDIPPDAPGVTTELEQGVFTYGVD